MSYVVKLPGIPGQTRDSYYSHRAWPCVSTGEYSTPKNRFANQYHHAESARQDAADFAALENVSLDQIQIVPVAVGDGYTLVEGEPV